MANGPPKIFFLWEVKVNHNLEKANINGCQYVESE